MQDDEIPIEISESFTDLGFPLYEWVYAGHGWTPFDLWMSFYTSQRPFGDWMDRVTEGKS